jgi:ATP-dependent protease ClpP protease subunit
MNFAKGLLAVVLLLSTVNASHAAIRIADDRGGQIGTYVAKYQGLRTSSETVIIDGLCASACTIVLGAVPHDRICVTSHANLAFHAAWDFGANGRAVTNPDATQMLYSLYPSPVRRWIAAHGGLKSQMIFLRGKELTSMYRPCYLDAQASSPR